MTRDDDQQNRKKHYNNRETETEVNSGILIKALECIFKLCGIKRTWIFLNFKLNMKFAKLATRIIDTINIGHFHNSSSFYLISQTLLMHKSLMPSTPTRWYQLSFLLPAESTPWFIISLNMGIRFLNVLMDGLCWFHRNIYYFQ